MTGPARVLFNGLPSIDALAFSRALHYGDGVFRTLLKYEDVVIDFDRQIDKLGADAVALGLAPPDGMSLRNDIAAVSHGVPACVVKVLLMRGGAGRGYRPQTDASDRLLLRYPLPQFDDRHWREGIAAIRSPVTMAAQPLLAGIKHLNRLDQVLASRGWPDGIDEAILADDLGRPVCGTRSNLFWVTRGVLHAPALDRCGVAGMMRAKLLDLAYRAGREVRIESQSWAALLDAEEAFVCNSLIGIWPLRRLDERDWSAPRPVTADLMRALAHPTLRA